MNELRAQVVAEALSWCGTPFHSGQRLKGVGVDCGQILLLVYEAVGIIPHRDPGYYPADYHLHRTEEWYLRLVEEFARPVLAPRMGDVVLWRFGRVYSHGAVVVEWPKIIHACFPQGKVMEDSAESGFFRDRKGVWRPMLFFDAIGD